MTEPHLHCDHECVCWRYYDHKQSGSAAPCKSDKCRYRFRLDSAKESEVLELEKWTNETLSEQKALFETGRYVHPRIVKGQIDQLEAVLWKIGELRQQEREQG